jgi:hypothetical protein
VNNRVPLPILVIAVAVMSSACRRTSAGAGSVSQATTTPSSTSTRALSDPFAYCTAVGTVDSPGNPYVGPKTPDAVVMGFKAAAGLESSTEPMDVLRQTTVWRCMGGKVYACNFGANLPCDSKADTSSEPTSGTTSYCEANPGAASIPMSVTGHATIYSWHCVGREAATLEQIDQADAAGYLKRIWYQIAPSP